MQPFDRLQSPDEEKIGALLRARAGVLPVTVGAFGEVRQMPDRPRKAALGVHAGGEAAGRDKAVNVAAGASQHFRVAPELRRAFGRKRDRKSTRLNSSHLGI